MSDATMADGNDCLEPRVFCPLREHREEIIKQMHTRQNGYIPWRRWMMATLIAVLGFLVGAIEFHGRQPAHGAQLEVNKRILDDLTEVKGDVKTLLHTKGDSK